MSEFVKDITCSACGFPHASGYGSLTENRIDFTDCGHCNFNSARGDSPTPERVQVLDWDGMRRYLEAEREWLQVDPHFHDYFAGTPQMAAEAHWYAMERDALGIHWEPGEPTEVRLQKTWHAAIGVAGKRR